MNYLLDTHVLIWAITEDEKLSALVQRTIENTNNNIFVSAITFWKIALKFSTGQLQLFDLLPDQFPELSLKMGFQLIPLTFSESANYYKLPITTHKDPFDRMLIWQAIQRDLTFISLDKRLKEYDSAGLKTLW